MIVRSLKCETESALRLERVHSDKWWYQQNCVNHDDDIVNKLNEEENASENGQIIDERPIIHVNSNDYLFNITKSATFMDVVFDGINSFGYIEAKLNDVETGDDF